MPRALTCHTLWPELPSPQCVAKDFKKATNYGLPLKHHNVWHMVKNIYELNFTGPLYYKQYFILLNSIIAGSCRVNSPYIYYKI